MQSISPNHPKVNQDYSEAQLKQYFQFDNLKNQPRSILRKKNKKICFVLLRPEYNIGVELNSNLIILCGALGPSREADISELLSSHSTYEERLPIFMLKDKRYYYLGDYFCFHDLIDANFSKLIMKHKLVVMPSNSESLHASFVFFSKTAKTTKAVQAINTVDKSESSRTVTLKDLMKVTESMRKRNQK